MQKFFQLVLLTILLILLNNLTLYSSISIKAVQISYINVSSYRELNNEFKKIKKHGFNTVIFRVFNNKFDRIYPFIPENKIKSKVGVYFKTKYAPVVNNCLKKVIFLCHKNGLKIIAWMETRYSNFGLKVKSLKPVIRFNFKNNKFVKGKGLSFFYKKNWRYILNIYYDLLKYKIDGILLQDDLKILVDEDFNKIAIKKFYKKTGIILNENNVNRLLYGNVKNRHEIHVSKLYKEWEDIKVKQLKKFLDYLIFHCKTKKKIKIWVNVNYETLHRPDLSRLWYAYDIKSLIDSNVDYFSVMIYQRQIKKELDLNDYQLKNFLKDIFAKANKFKKLYKTKFIFKIQAYDWYKDKEINRKKIFSLLTFLKKNNIKNIAIFPYYKKLFQ